VSTSVLEAFRLAYAKAQETPATLTEADLADLAAQDPTVAAQARARRAEARVAAGALETRAAPPVSAVAPPASHEPADQAEAYLTARGVVPVVPAATHDPVAYLTAVEKLHQAPATLTRTDLEALAVVSAHIARLAQAHQCGMPVPSTDGALAADVFATWTLYYHLPLALEAAFEMSQFATRCKDLEARVLELEAQNFTAGAPPGRVEEDEDR